MLSLTPEAELKLVQELCLLPRHFNPHGAKGVEFGCSWPDMTMTATLLSPCAWWPANRAARARTKAHHLGKALELAEVRRLIEPGSGKVYCIYSLSGRPRPDIQQMRFWCARGELHADQIAYKANLDLLLGAYMDAKDSARKRFANLANIEKGVETIAITD